MHCTCVEGPGLGASADNGTADEGPPSGGPGGPPSGGPGGPPGGGSGGPPGGGSGELGSRSGALLLLS